MKLYIARDEDGELYLANVKQIKIDDYYHWQTAGEELILSKSWFPEVKWTDKKPTEVEIKIKKK